MLTNCVMMSLYSIARFLHSPPTPPFQLGGWFTREAGRLFLSDAQTRLELKGPLAIFANLKDGDQVHARVLGWADTSIECDKVECVVRSQRAGRSTAGCESADFARFVRKVRDFFVRRGLSEVHTPSLVICPGLEPHLEPFAVNVARGREKITAYLPTSPEIHLKKAMTLGWTDIFEIRSCFRRGEFSPHHENEFLMLEWYRGFADLALIESDLRELVKAVGGPAAPELTVTTFKKLFHEILDFDLRPTTSLGELRVVCDAHGIHCLEEDSFNDLFHRLLIDVVEPRFKSRGPLIVRDFPPSQAALARLTEDGWADRFEFYWNGLEIANAFHEVTDPEEQARRWRLEQEERCRLGTSEVPQDPALIEALRVGMPPSGGIALGMERLYMAGRELSEIRDLRLFSSDDLFDSV